MITKKCDKCGLDLIADPQNPWEAIEAKEIKFRGGYDSVFGDGVEVRIDLCQHCLLKILKKEKLWPITK